MNEFRLERISQLARMAAADWVEANEFRLERISQLARIGLVIFICSPAFRLERISQLARIGPRRANRRAGSGLSAFPN